MAQVWLPIEVSKRELPGRALLATEMAARGHQVAIGRDREVWSLVDSLPGPGVALMKSVGHAPQRRVNAGLRAAGVRLIAQDEEAGITYKHFSDFLSERVSLNHFGALDRFACWTEEEASTLSQVDPANKHILRQTGGLRTSCWGANGERIFGEEVADLRNAYGRFILVNTNFGTANSGRGSRAEWKYQRSFGHGTGRDYREWIEEYKAEKQRIEIFKATVTAIVQSLDLHVVIRPHPSESPVLWRDFAKKLPRVSVYSDGPVTPLILAAEAVVQNRCTTGLEAMLSLKPTIDLDLEFPENSLESQNGYVAAGKDEALELLRWAVSESQSFVSSQGLGGSSRLIGAGTAEPVISLANEIEELGEGMENRPRAYRQGVNPKITAVKNAIHPFLSTLTASRRYTEYKRGRIALPRIARLLEASRRLLKIEGNPIELEQVAPNTFVLSSTQSRAS